jgi:peptidoglycan hydrolase-like protein with peptidoglycan-binding domain
MFVLLALAAELRVSHHQAGVAPDYRSAPVKGEPAVSAPQPQVQVTLSLPVLRNGVFGSPTVERLQTMLNFVGGLEGTTSELVVDGDFGPNTEQAVRGFQGNENLAVDGIVGRQTWTALLNRWLLQSAPG